ncbi:unnamed protein product [Ixodes pacificus]
MFATHQNDWNHYWFSLWNIMFLTSRSREAGRWAATLPQIGKSLQKNFNLEPRPRG